MLAFDSDPKEGFFQWGRDQEVLEKGDLGFCNEKGAIWTVVLLGWLGALVLLGWLGAKPNHLNNYAGLYSSKGIKPVRFIIPVKKLLGLDLGRRVQEKIARFTKELVSWGSETDDGRGSGACFFTPSAHLLAVVVAASLRSLPLPCIPAPSQPPNPWLLPAPSDHLPLASFLSLLSSISLFFASVSPQEWAPAFDSNPKEGFFQWVVIRRSRRKEILGFPTRRGQFGAEA